MNPYFQESWGDVHSALIQEIRRELSATLPDDLIVRTEEMITVSADEQSRLYRPDVALLEPWREGHRASWQPEESDGAIAIAEPLIVYVEPHTERHVEIRDKNGQLITVIEVLSPANKESPGADAYRRKRHDFIAGGVALVEIDLIRGGTHVTAADTHFVKSQTHHICVTRPQFPNRREIYLCPLREPLPGFRVPLRPADRDVPLALQPLVERCYEAGRYWLGDYSRDPDPPVAPEDAAWVDGRLREAGLRK